MSECANLNKNKRIFLIFNMSGAPAWCIVMSYRCGLCDTHFNGNYGRLLASVPPHICDVYPEEPCYPSTSTPYHVDKLVTILYDNFLNTYANGNHISRCLYRVINEDYKYRVTQYFSLWSEAKKHSPALYETETYDKKE